MSCQTRTCTCTHTWKFPQCIDCEFCCLEEETVHIKYWGDRAAVISFHCSTNIITFPLQKWLNQQWNLKLSVQAMREVHANVLTLVCSLLQCSISGTIRGSLSCSKTMGEPGFELWTFQWLGDLLALTAEPPTLKSLQFMGLAAKKWHVKFKIIHKIIGLRSFRWSRD